MPHACEVGVQPWDAIGLTKSRYYWRCERGLIKAKKRSNRVVVDDAEIERQSLARERALEAQIADIRRNRQAYLGSRKGRARNGQTVAVNP